MNIKVDKEANILPLVIVSVLMLGAIPAIYAIFFSQETFERVFYLLWVCFVIIFAYKALNQPTNIQLENNNTLIFSSKLKTQSHKISDLKEIKNEHNQLHFIFNNTKVSMSYQITGLHLFLIILSDINGNITYKGI